jgi:hypothetical protein
MNMQFFSGGDKDGMDFGIGYIVQTSFKITKMKKYIYTPVLVMLFTAFMTVRAQDRQEEYLGLPGDNLNLYAVMKLFQESETLEGFERQLNEENSRVNNLDLDGDGYVDYINVIDNVDKNVHYIVLQVAVSSREKQDVAVFTVVRDANGQVQIQLIGDEALYGRNYIVEPIYDETPNPGYMGNTNDNRDQHVEVYRTTTYEIAAWPLIRIMFLPGYMPWRSPWYYRYYPSFWHPWNPFSWDYYYGYNYHNNYYYYGHYRPWHEYRHPYYESNYYHSQRAYSPHVSGRINDGRYKETYSHPEQRREGMALYERTHPDQVKRSTGSQSENPAGRRSASERAPGGQPSGTSTNRRPATDENTRQSTGTSTERRSTTPGSTQKPTGTSTERRTTTSGDTRKSTGTSTEKRTTTSGSTRESTGKSTERRSTTPGGPRQSTSSNTDRRSTVSGSNSGRRSGKSNSSASSTKAQEKSGGSSSTRSSGRR